MNGDDNDQGFNAGFKSGSMTGAVSILNLLKDARPDAKIECIKYVRQHTGCGLKEAKDLVEGIMGSMSAMQERYDRPAPHGWAHTGDVDPRKTYLVTWYEHGSCEERTFDFENDAIHAAKVTAEREDTGCVRIALVTHEVTIKRVADVKRV